ncbi:NAD(P)-binding protein [Psychrobacter sp. SCQQ22]|uniref:NAD(P)/FAD-dependent oxidoreductase n=1 Tax=Psychrobacter sp. SCQQ22 TaxID=2792059 RepID=UPI0018CCEC29|nr:NAD(P)-binding protein [Psychrobacter sp. SCQQ22]MBH0084903.1 NAD(P)-binding protein [Psychrobacter sp. SCQQ22]
MTHHPLNRTDTTSPKIAIIGGGLTGLFTATLLERAFSQDNDKTPVLNITIFEKSRSVGRLATRYRTDSQTGKNWQWAFGAQFFTAKTASFRQFIAPWLETGLLQPWCAQVVNLMPENDSIESSDIQSKEQWNTTQARYISTPKMTSWGRELADKLQHTTIKFKTRVAPLDQYDSAISEKVDKKTELFDDTCASLGHFDWVICTAPNGQAVELMADSGFDAQSKIAEPQMQACYTLMLGWSDIATLPKALSKDVQPEWDVAYLSDSILDRIFIEHQKPAHDDLLPSVTIHASNHWSEQHVDDDIETVQAQLLQAAQQALNWNEESAPSQIDSHRWRYAATVVNDNNDKSASGILVDETHQWIVSGDWCGQGNIESCYQMAQQTVEAIYYIHKVV